MNIDLTSFTLAQVLLFLSAIVIVDVASGILGALVGGTFSWAVLPTFLESHVLMRVFPIAGAILLAESVPASNATHQLLWGLADAGIVAYFASTIASIQTNLTTASVPRTVNKG